MYIYHETYYYYPTTTTTTIASYNGSLKFFDIRNMRSFRTLDVHKGPQSCFKVHPRAPILASGSTDQFIKLGTLSGEQLQVGVV